MRKWFIIVGIIAIVLVAIFVGAKFAGVIGGIITAFFGGKKYSEKKSKKRIEEAGEQYEPKTFDNADNAANYIDDILSKLNGRDE